MNRNLILLSSLFLLQFSSFPIKAAPPSIAQNSICKIEREDEFYSTKELQTLANKITVKVIGDNNGGSGTLIGKQGNNYLVLTNSHVVRGVNSIKLQTADGKTYSAEILPQEKFKNSDISLLKFQSNQSYCLSEISTATPDINTTILASGFSGSTGKITFSSGEVKKTSKLKDGYEIGYSSNIEQGMSGGGILNSMGELVGINGKSAYPILNSGYVYQNGKRPNESEIREMRKLSWGIPISTVLAWVDSDVLTAYKLPLPQGKPTILEPDYPKWVKDVEQKAKQFTVRIDSGNNNGSGIIIAKEGNTYTVLTSAHVVSEKNKHSYEILTPDDSKYPVDKSSIKIESGVDLAVVKFKSSEDYQIATLADYNFNNEDLIFTGGYPKLANNSRWRLTVGQIADQEFGLLVAKDSDFSLPGVGSFKSKNIGSLTGGYELIYTSITYGGMSGGPVLDSQGRVIGIHGRAEATKVNNSNINDGKIQIGFSLGIPVSTFLGLAPRLGIAPQKLENTRSPKLDTKKVESIKKAVLSAKVPKTNATAALWLERGNQLWRLGMYEEANKAFDQVIKQKPSLAYLAHYGKGFSFEGQDKDKESIAALEEAIKLKPNFVVAWRLISFMHMGSEQYDKALIAANKAIQLQPQNPNGYLAKGIILANLERFAEAEPVITEAIKLNPRAISYTFRGITYVIQQKWDLAKADLDKAIKVNPQSVYAYLIRGIIYWGQGKSDLALADFNQSIKINPKNAFFNTYDYRGRLYLQQEKWDLAKADFDKAIELDYKSDEAYAYRGLVYLRQQKWDLAKADINKAIELNPKSDEAYFARGLYHISQQKLDSALADFNKAIELNPKSEYVYQFRGRLYLQQQKWDLAKADLDKAIELNFNSADAYAYRGMIYIGQQKWDLAKADINKAIELNPQSYEAYFVRRVYYTTQKKVDLALADFDKTIELNPKSDEAYTLRGNLYLSQEKWDLAKSNLDKAIKLNSKSANAYAYRGMVYVGQQKWDLAKADINKAIELNPKLDKAYFVRGAYYSTQQKIDLALADYNKAIELNSKFSEAYGYRGMVYVGQQKWDLAKADFNQAIQINPNSADAYFGLGIYYVSQKKWNLAVADLNKAIKIRPNYVEVYTIRGNIYKNQQKWDLALADFNKVIQINSNDAEAYTNRGIVIIKKGNKQQAIQDLQKAAQLFKAQNNTAAYELVVKELQELQK